MSQYGYGGQQNPFDQRDPPSYGGGGGGRAPPQAAFGQGPRPGGGAPRYNQGPAMGRDEYGSGNVEMASLAQNAGAFANNGDPNAILNECRSIDQGIDKVEQNLNQLRMLQDRSLGEADSSGSATSRQLDALSSETMALYRELTERVRQVKSQADARQPKNAPQVGRVDRRLKNAIQSYQQLESAFRKKTQDQMARQYRIVKPEASEQEVRAVVEDNGAGGGQVFQQAMMQSNRQGQARAVLNAVQDRHAALQRIEQQMIELAQLFQDMDTLVMQQDVAIVQIEQKGEEVVENLDKGNEEITVAVETAKKTRRKKWWCLGICVAIIVVIAVIITVYMLIKNPPGGNKDNKKRSAVALDGDLVPLLSVAQNNVVIPGAGALNDEINAATADADLATKFGMLAGGPARVRIGKRFVRVGVPYTPEEPQQAAAKSESSAEKRYVLPGVVFHEPQPEPPIESTGKEKRYVVPGQDWDGSN